MKNKKISVRILSFVMIVALMIGVCAPMVSAATDDHDHANGEINYVSIGDSMTNGYCFEGYAQGEDSLDFFSGEGVYGEDAYPLQFQAYLESKGYDVNHTKLAPSAMRAEDLLYLLGGREMPTDGWFDQVNHYTNCDDDEALSEYFTNAVTEADIMTMCIGNASFGAYFVQAVTRALGVMGGSLDEDEKVDLEDALAIVESEEAKEIVLEVYEELKAELAPYLEVVTAAGFTAEQVEDVLGIVTYTTASFVVNYEALLDKIVELNPDAEIILVGLMNTTYGMTITGEGFDPVPFGDIMDKIFATLNAYIAGLPAGKQAFGEYADATFYYAEQPKPEFIVQAFDDLAAAGWKNVDCGADDCGTVGHDCGENGRLSADIVRNRSLKAYNNDLRGMIGSALGFALPRVELTDIENYVFDEVDDQYQITTEFKAQASQYNGSNSADLPLVSRYIEATGDTYLSQAAANAGNVFKADIEKEISIAIYLALEEAVVANVDTMEITLDGLMGIAGDIFSALGAMPDAINPANNPGPWTIKTGLVGWFTGSATSNAMCKVYGLFKIGDGMSVHPTPKGHDNMADAVIEAYENKYTVADETINNLLAILDLLLEYYDEAYAYAYDEAVKAGVIAELNGYLDIAQEAIDAADAWILANSDYIRSEEFALELKKASADARATVEALRALINNADELDAESYEYLLKLVAALNTNVEDFVALLGIAVVDFNSYITPKIEELEAQAEKQIAILVAQAQKQLEILNEQLQTAVGEAKEAILAEIARVKAELAEKIAEIEAHIEATSAELKAAYDAAKAELEALIEKMVTDTEAAIADAKAKINAIIDAANKFFMETIPATIKQLINDALTGEYVRGEDSYYLAIGSDPMFAELLAANFGLEDKFAVNAWDEISIEDLIKADLITISYNENELTGFAMDQAVGFVADYVNKSFRPSFSAYMQKAFTEFFAKCNPAPSPDKVTEFMAMLDAMLNDTLDGVTAEYFGDATAVEMDWAALVGEANAAYVDEARAEIKAALNKAGVSETISVEIPVLDLFYANLDMFGEMAEYINTFDEAEIKAMFGENATYTLEIPVADALVFAGESYLYGLAQFAKNYNETILTVNAINPDATVVLLGYYNAFEGVTFNGVDLGRIYGEFAKVASANAFVYALAFDNVTYVDISDAETWLEVYANGETVALEDFIIAYLMDPSITSVSEAGHEYIYEQIKNAISFTCAHVWEEATCTAPKTCKLCGETEGDVAAHDPNADDGDCTTPITCKDCGTITTPGNTAHTPAADDGDCTTPITCKDCGTITTPGNTAHTPAADDGDCTTAIKCTVCNKVTTEAKAAHTYGEWTVTKEATATEAGERKHVCSVCGHTETEVIPALGVEPEETTKPAETTSADTTPVDDSEGLSGGAIAGITVGSVAVVGVGGFSIFWFVIKKKSWADFLLIFKK